jgi:acyl-coenzyme A synthetase/AMP-(fatty) acid ligase
LHAPPEPPATAAIPLLAHANPGDVLAYRGARAFTAREFIADAARLAARLPAGRHALNVCADRYRFAVGLAACLMSGRISLLPSTYTPDVIRQLQEFAPDAFCLSDDPACDIALPRMLLGPDDEAGDVEIAWPAAPIPVSQLAAIVFTSGSTGVPLPYRKTWGRLARCVQSGAPRLGLVAGRSFSLIGTVPAQHMYGFESTVLLALQSGNAFGAERPFYPADICACLEAARRPRALISTPIHLRTLLAADMPLPQLDLIVSATAPLPPELARAVEQGFGAELIEIYGSTETGQIATRRTACESAWRLWAGVELSGTPELTFAAGGHIEQRTALCDVIEITGPERFLLHGRSADLVNIAGKRSSFAYLNQRLTGIPGVLDGAFFLGGEEGAGTTRVARLAAVVVAPGWTAAALTERLRETIDAVFLPRPLLLVERLPRNATGKLPRHALQALLAAHPPGRI